MCQYLCHPFAERVPRFDLHGKRLAAMCGELVIPRPAAVLTDFPFGFDHPVTVKAVERGVERAFLDVRVMPKPGFGP